MPGDSVPDIVSFEQPPVTETVLSVAFEPVQGLTTAHLGQFLARYLPEYPRIDEQPAYSMPLERVTPGPAPMSLTLESGAPPLRTVVVNEPGDELYQLQRDWLAFNWRRVGEPSSYPRYPYTRSRFLEGWDLFQKFVDETSSASGPVVPVQGEVTYVNHIEANHLHGRQSDYAQIFPLLNDVDLGSTVGPLESAVLRATALIRGTEEPIGRLHIHIHPAVSRNDGTEIYVLNLTARGRLEGPTTEGITKFLDAGRQAIVEAFANVTDPELHERWNDLQ